MSNAQLFLMAISASALSDGGVQGTNFTACVISVKGANTFDDAAKVGIDVADVYPNYQDPCYAFTPAPSITLFGPTRCGQCGWAKPVGGCDLSNINTYEHCTQLNPEVAIQWNNEWETCILNGAGYPMPQPGSEWPPSKPQDKIKCSNSYFAPGVDNEQNFEALLDKWVEFAFSDKTQKYKDPDHTNPQNYVYITSIPKYGIENVAMSIGHGVLDGGCGSCSLIRLNDKYVVNLQADVRAWSLELSVGANTWLAKDNVGGTCYVPDVMEIDCNDVLNQ